MQNLVIVESPTKARTLSKYLGKKYQIEASMGHIRDLPKGNLGVDVAKNFEPQYVIPRDKKKRVNALKKSADAAQEVWLATDPDREGEAIAWHLAHIIGKKGLKRVVFHEITKEAIEDAFKHPRAVDLKLVDAQQARRVLDRLVGYKLSPLLWKKVKRGLSAGRVQTVALRLIVERENEIKAFVPVEYWSIEVELESAQQKDPVRFIAALIEKNGRKLEVKNGEEAKGHVTFLEKAAYAVKSITKKEVRRLPGAPFTTSTLQQVAGNRLGMSAKRTMMIAQNLYEHGFITYMRTDSVTLSQQALTGAREVIASDFGQEYLPASPRMYKAKSKNAQEAHEAIRPTDLKVGVDAMKNVSDFGRDHFRLYELIWKRTIASQMNDAKFDQTTVDILASPSARQPVDTKDEYTLRATGSVMKFDGWMKLYGKTKELEKSEELEKTDEKNVQKEQNLPELSEKEPLNMIELLPKQHFTEPSPRYTEATLIKKLEELGIGRPSTYAPIISTIEDRFYVEKTERKFIPTALGFTVTEFLVKYFPDVFNYDFTAGMEDRLDEIARGEREWKSTIGDFYKPIELTIEKTQETAEKVQLQVETVDKNCSECGKQLVVRTGKFGKFLACSGFPDCKHTEAFEEKVDVKCPDCRGDITIRKTRKGKPFYGCKNWPECKFASWTKPKAAEEVPTS